MKWRDEFLNQRINKTVRDLQTETKIKKTDRKLSEILKKQNQKARNDKIRKEVEKLLE